MFTYIVTIMKNHLLVIIVALAVSVVLAETTSPIIINSSMKKPVISAGRFLFAIQQHVLPASTTTTISSRCMRHLSSIATITASSNNSMNKTSNIMMNTRRLLALSSSSSSIPRGGGGDASSDINNSTSNDSKSTTAYETNALPAPGSPFHYAFPIHDLEAAKDFYSRVLGCQQGRSSDKWQDYSLHGHQIVCHWVGNDYKCIDYYNPVDGDEVPVPHAGLALTVEQFHALAHRVEQAGIEFIIKPHLRFIGMPGEQYTMFFKDPSGNNLEFKAMTKPENLFAKYNVVE